MGRVKLLPGASLAKPAPLCRLSRQATPTPLPNGATTTTEEKPVAKDTYSGSFYCVKCKDHREASGDVSVNEKGTRIAKAKCPVCGTNLTRFLPKA